MATTTFARPRTRRTRPGALLSPLATAALATLGLPTWAQTATSQTDLPAVVVTGRILPAAITGFGDQPAARTPLQATVVGSSQLKEAGIDTLAELTRLDASVADAYNSAGYWSILQVRGFTLDNRFNYRRDGLPINAETALTLLNKERVEILKGTSGIQAGTSAPGGLVNLVVKRPEGPVRSVQLGWEQRGTVFAHADLGERFGPDEVFGLRLNVGAERLSPLLDQARGQARTFALAGDWRISPDTVLEAEFEHSRRRQPSQPGFSLLGSGVPDAAGIDPRTNLNNQPWSLPVELSGHTASLRVRQKLEAGWQLTAQAMAQRLDSNDRVAFPFGCTAADGSYYADRYCPDGTFDLYDFRSDGERRHTDVVDLTLQGQTRTGDIDHRLAFGVQSSTYRQRMNRQAFNWAGTGNIAGTLIGTADARLTDENTQRDERTLEFSARDVMQLSRDWSLWAGLRHTHLHRESVRTDGSRPTAYDQAFTTPWAALAWQLDPATLVYASAGQGVQSDVTPNRTRYTNAGQPLPAQRSRQVEIGLKQDLGAVQWTATAFEIRQPAISDLGACDNDATCTRQFDGIARHRGLELAAEGRAGTLSLRGSALALHARREGSAVASLNGTRPVNVPAVVLKAQAGWQVTEAPGLTLTLGLNHEGARMALPDNSASIPAWTTLDLGARYTSTLAGSRATWRAGIDNLTDRRAWRESPYQFGHAYLYPLAPRTLRASLQLDL